MSERRSLKSSPYRNSTPIIDVTLSPVPLLYQQRSVSHDVNPTKQNSPLTSPVNDRKSIQTTDSPNLRLPLMKPTHSRKHSADLHSKSITPENCQKTPC